MLRRGDKIWFHFGGCVMVAMDRRRRKVFVLRSGGSEGDGGGDLRQQCSKMDGTRGYLSAFGERRQMLRLAD